MNNVFLQKWTHSLPKARGVYVVGGTLRDLLLGLRPADCDLATESDPLDYAQRLARSTEGRLVPLGKPGKMVYRVITAGVVYDVCSVEGGSISADLKRRDFTINAIALDIDSGKILDVTGGLEDISSGCIRMVSQKAFDADPLRLLRAYRIGASLGFDIEPSTVAAICKRADRICATAAERIREELAKFFQNAASYTYLLQMAQSGLLFSIFPELESLQGCTQNSYHHHDAWHHTLAAYRALEELLTAPRWTQRRFFELTRSVSLHGGMLKFAMLLHDIGKPLTRAGQNGSSVHFYGHQKQGALLVGTIADRLRCSLTEKKQLCFLVENHMRPMQLFLLDRHLRMTPRARARFFVKCGQQAPDILLMALADHGGKSASGHSPSGGFTTFILDLFDQYRHGARRRLEMPLPINGHDLIHDLGLHPSPLFSHILAEIREALLTGAVTDRASALALSAEIAGRKTEQQVDK